jgi:hypothetical protein
MTTSRTGQRKPGCIARSATLVLLTFAASPVSRAAADPACERYALREVLPGMKQQAIRATMGGEGIVTRIRAPDGGETSGVAFPGPPSDVYVEFDHRIDRRPAAQAVLVRVSMPPPAGAILSLVDRFGPPDAGARALQDGLREGAAVWVDEACGFVMTAFRPPASWWTGEGGMWLQIETMERVRKGGSPASASLDAILLSRAGRASASVAPLPPPPPLQLTIRAGREIVEAQAVPPPH